MGGGYFGYLAAGVADSVKVNMKNNGLVFLTICSYLKAAFFVWPHV